MATKGIFEEFEVLTQEGMKELKRKLSELSQRKLSLEEGIEKSQKRLDDLIAETGAREGELKSVKTSIASEQKHLSEIRDQFQISLSKAEEKLAKREHGVLEKEKEVIRLVGQTKEGSANLSASCGKILKAVEDFKVSLDRLSETLKEWV